MDGAAGRRYRALFDGAEESAFITDGRLMLLDANAAGARLLGHDRAELIGTDLSGYVPAEHIASVNTYIDRMLREASTGSCLPLRHKNGRLHLGEMMPICIGPDLYVHLVSDVIERRQSEACLERLGFLDPVTRLGNHNAFMQRLDRALLPMQTIGVVLLSITNFRDIVERHGFPAAEAVLKQVATRLTAKTIRREVLARLNNADFAVVVDGIGHLELVAPAVERLLAAAPARVWAEGADVEVELHAGIAISPDDGRDALELLRRAAVALFEAQRRGHDFLHYHGTFDRLRTARLSEALSGAGVRSAA